MSSDTDAAIAAAQVAAAAQYAAAVEVANSSYNATVSGANIQANAEISVANIRAGADETVANIQANASEIVAQTDSGWHANVAQIQASASEIVAQTGSQAQIQSAQIEANSQIAVAEIGSSYQTTVATIRATADETVATTQANATVQSANIDATARETVASTQATASNYQADQQVACANINQAGETSRLNTTLSFADNIFNQVFPLVESAVGGSTGGSGGGIGFYGPPSPGGGVSSPRMGFGGVPAADDKYTFGTYSSRRISGNLPSVRAGWGGGDIPAQGIGFGAAASPTTPDAVAQTNLPFITTSGVLTPSQIQQLVNAAVAKADQRATSQIKQLIGDMSGRGFSVNSPIVSALTVGIQGQSLQSQMATASQIRVDSAKANADAIFNGQKALSDQFIQQEGILNDGAKNEVQRVVGVLSAVCGMVGGIA